MVKTVWGLLLFLLISSSAKSQLEAYNMLYLEDEPYLILNTQIEDGSCFGYLDSRSIFRITDGEIHFDSTLSQDEGAVFDCTHAGEGSQIDYSGNLVVSKVYENEKQLLKLLSKGGVDIEEWSSELVLLSFQSGVLKSDVCIGEENVYCSSGYGRLSVGAWDDYWSMNLYQGGKLIISLMNDCEYCYGNFKLLPTGVYTLKVDYGDQGKMTVEEIEIKQDETTHVDLNTYVWDRGSYGYGTSIYSTGVGVLDILYTNSNMVSIVENEAPTSFHIGSKLGLKLFGDKLGLSKFVGTYGFDFGYVGLNNEFDSLGVKEVKRTNYTGVYYTADFFYRQYFSLPLSHRFTRPFIDIGASYRLPLYFRKNTVMQGLRISEKWLHKFNELVLFTRIGISNGVALNATYRPFGSIKNGLSELPKLQLGLSIMLDVY